MNKANGSDSVHHGDREFRHDDGLLWENMHRGCVNAHFDLHRQLSTNDNAIYMRTVTLVTHQDHSLHVARAAFDAQTPPARP